MNQRVMFASLLLVVFACSVATAGPILKPRKYQGPIPRSSITLRGGFLGGATNEEMFDYLDSQAAPPFEAFSDDFGTAPLGEIAYTYKLHPQFAVRGNFSWARLKGTGEGVFVPNVDLPDTVAAPAVEYDREFKVDLFTIEGSAIYYLTDASVKEFQPYLGAGLSLGIPYQRFEETQIVAETDPDGFYTRGEIFNEISESSWSAEAGVHAVLGALYYFGNRWAGTIEGRVQMLQSTFSLETVDEVGQVEDVNFVVKYNGFTLALGVSYAF